MNGLYSGQVIITNGSKFSEKYTNLQQIKTKGKRAKYISIKYKNICIVELRSRSRSAEGQVRVRKVRN